MAAAVPARVRRRRLVAFGVVAGFAALLVVSAASVLALGGGTRAVALRIAGSTAIRVRVVNPAGHRRSVAVLERVLPSTVTVVRGGVRTVFAIERPRVAAALARAKPAELSVPARPLASYIGAPAVAQALRDNCETAALQVLLATVGVDADQLTLQRQLPRSGPLDPNGQGPDAIWGDPDEGYVGRADGGGQVGGFGVYPGPIARLAARYGRRLIDLTGAPAQAVYRRLLAGHAVLAWVGLGDGPYWTWRSPSGRTVRANLNEHAVVLNGIRPNGSLEVVNVLRGTREIWTGTQFEQAWQLLGQRALTTS